MITFGRVDRSDPWSPVIDVLLAGRRIGGIEAEMRNALERSPVRSAKLVVAGYTVELYDETLNLDLSQSFRVTPGTDPRTVLSAAKAWARKAVPGRAEKNPKRPITTRVGDGSGRIRDDWSSEPPFAPDDEITVYHGFYDRNEAVSAARYGLSGRDPVSRNYSFESDNNPRGLFVSIDLQTAASFATDRRMAVVMEFDTKLDDLEAPVWPGGGYTVQGERAEYFYGKHARHLRRLEVRREAARSGIRAVAAHPRPELIETLFGPELQALFVGDLNPERISAFWVDGVRMSRDQFVARTAEIDLPTKGMIGYIQDRPTRPEDPWNATEFLRVLAARRGDTPEIVAYGLSRLGTKSIKEASLYLTWPRQLPGFLRWWSRLRNTATRPNF